MTPKIEEPICPICDAVMVAYRYEYEDGSGWFFGWACDCTAEMRDEVYG